MILLADSYDVSPVKSIIVGLLGDNDNVGLWLMVGELSGGA